MRQAEYIFFDLDGTLTDSRPGIFHSFRHTLAQYGMTAGDADLQPCLGPPLTDSFMQQFGFPRQRAEEAVRIYRAFYDRCGKMENSVYPGVEEMLKALRAAGKRLMVATSKAEVLAKEIIAHFGLEPYFERIAGASLDETRSTKEAVLRYLLAQIPGSAEAVEAGAIVMVGDRKYDVLGAKEVGIPCIGVRYGYAPPGELEEAGAVAMADTPARLTGLLLNGYSV